MPVSLLMVLLSLIIHISFLPVNIDQKLNDFQTRVIIVLTTSLCSTCFNTFSISFTGGTKRLFSFFYDSQNASTHSVPGQ